MKQPLNSYTIAGLTALAAIAVIATVIAVGHPRRLRDTVVITEVTDTVAAASDSLPKDNAPRRPKGGRKATQPATKNLTPQSHDWQKDIVGH